MAIKDFNCSSVGVKCIDIEAENNARLEVPADFETAISKTGYGRFNYLLLLAALPAACSSVFDTTAIAYALPKAGCDLDLSNFDKGLLNGGMYMGMISSALLWGFLSDKLGRRKLLVIGYFLDGIVGLLSSISPTFWMLLLFKFISGFIISGPFAVMISYLAEFHSAHYRARVLMINSVYVSLAQTLVPVLAWMFMPQTWSWDFGGGFIFSPWRCFLLISALPSLLGALTIYFFDESPKFLMSSGRNEEALKVFQKIYQMNTGNLPAAFPVKLLLDERIMRKPSISETEHGIFKTPIHIFHMFWKQTKPLMVSPYISKVMLIFCIQFISMFATNTVRLWLPQLFATMQEFTYSADPNKSVSLCDMLVVDGQVLSNNSTTTITEECSLGSMDSETYFKSMIVACTTGISYLLVSYLINITGKRYLMMFGSGVAGMCGIALYWSRNVDLTLALISLFMALAGITVGAILSVVVDVFPTNLRTMAVSLTMMSGRTGSLLGNLIFPILLDLSCELPFFLVSGMTICSSCLSFFLPKTLMKALE